MYNPDELHNLVGLVQDENHDPQIFNLKMPNPVNVLIQYVGFDKYQISFCGINSKLIYDTIIDKALKIIESTECILATFTETDPIDTDELKQILNNAIVVSIPDENTLERDSKITYVEIFFPFLNDEIYNDVISKLDDYFYKVNLAVCKKCTLFFSPNSDDPCYKLFHKGQQIPFESGEMEEVQYDEKDHYITVNYTCCGEVPKDEIPINCGKEENGRHEIDEKIGIISVLKITRTKPGQIKQKEIEYKHKFS